MNHRAPAPRHTGPEVVEWYDWDAAEADRVATAMVPIETEADAARAIQLYEAKPMGRA